MAPFKGRAGKQRSLDGEDFKWAKRRIAVPVVPGPLAHEPEVDLAIMAGAGSDITLRENPKFVNTGEKVGNGVNAGANVPVADGGSGGEYLRLNFSKYLV
jgi:hypothetical protein